MSDSNHLPPGSDALERSLSEIMANEPILDGRNGRCFQEALEGVVEELTSDPQLPTKLLTETRVGFGMALGKFLAWKAWTEIEKADKKRAASRATQPSFTLRLPARQLEDVKAQWPTVCCGFFERVGLALPSLLLEPADDEWSLEMRGGLLESRRLPEDWFQPLLTFLVEQSPRMLTLSMVKDLMESVKGRDPAVAEELERLRMPVTTVYRVLEGLLQEAVPVHELETILTAVILQWEQGSDRQQLLSSVRAALSPWICRSVQVRPGVVRALRVGNRIEEAFAESVRYLGGEQVFALDPPRRAMIIVLLKQAVKQAGGPGQVVLLAANRIRQELRQMLVAEIPGIVVLGEDEIHRGFRVEVPAVVDLTEPVPGGSKVPDSEFEPGLL